MINSVKTADDTPFTTEQFAKMGGGQVAYVKSMRSEDAQRAYPQVEGILPGMQLFALLEGRTLIIFNRPLEDLFIDD